MNESEIADTFLKVTGSLAKVNVISKDSDNFGNFSAIANIGGASFFITRERSQYFVDCYDNDLKIPGHKKWPKLAGIYRTGSWSLEDILRAIFSSN